MRVKDNVIKMIEGEYSHSLDDGMITLKHDGGTISLVRFAELAEEFLEEQLEGFITTNLLVNKIDLEENE